MTDRILRPVLAATLLCAPFVVAAVHAADFVTYRATPLKGPDCIVDAGPSFVAQNVQPAEPPHPTLPIGRYYMIVRYVGADSIGAPASSDFGHFAPTYAWPPYRGMPLTGLTVPDPKPAWQRARRADATLDDSSAFQLHCYDAGSFINSWTFADDETITGGGPHTIYGYSFDDAQTPAVYDGDPATDFVLQASIEIPWFAAWPNPAVPAGNEPIGQVNLFAYFRDRTSGSIFALLFAIFDNRTRDDAHPTYSAFIAHDGSTPFASMPFDSNARYGTLSPYSAAFTGTAWAGLRFFRVHVTQANFRQALADINAFCVAHSAQRYCSATTFGGNAFSADVRNFEITDFGIIHEIGRVGIDGNLSMGVHIFDLGAWNFR